MLAVAIGAMALSSALFYHHVTESGRPSHKIVSLLGPKYRGFKDYDTDGADRRQRTVVDSASVCITRTGLLTEQGAYLSEKLLRYEPASEVWEVVYWHDGGLEDDPHTTAVFVEVSKNLACKYLGMIEQ